MSRGPPAVSVIQRRRVPLRRSGAFRERADYDSVNDRWFARRYASFPYIDRVVVDRCVQASGAGTLPYRRAFVDAAETGASVLGCECAVEPPNPASARFHAKSGFREAGRQRVADGGKQVSLQVAAAGRS